MDFYYDAVLGLAYFFQPNILILNVSEIPQHKKYEAGELLDMFYAKGVIIKNASDEDQVEVGLRTPISSNLFSCDYPIEYATKAVYDGTNSYNVLINDEIGQWQEHKEYWEI
tara:strand:- start:11579 stop:11914 length:336 start_codon:yes stop_codon:yes gene_type:complete